MDLSSETLRLRRESKLLAACEFALVGLLFFADSRHWVPFSKTPFLLVLGWISLRWRGLRWKDVGLTGYRSWSFMLTAGVLAGLFIEVFELFVSQPLVIRLTGKQPDLSDLDAIAGNWKALLLGLVLTWTLAAFGEEMVWRGYLMNRVADIFRNKRVAWVLSLLVVSVVFGCSHSDQGSTGMIENIWDGILLGILYLICGRNLAVPIIAHGVTDTVDLILLFLRKYPGIH